MHSTLRLVLVLFLIALLVHNYNSNKILDVSVRLLNQDVDRRAELTASSIASRLSQRIANQTVDSIALTQYLSDEVRQHGIAGIVWYEPGASTPQYYPAELASRLAVPLPAANAVSKQSIFRAEGFLFAPGSFSTGEQARPFLVVFDNEQAMHLGRSANIIGYLNIFILAFAFILAFYLVQSTIHPFRALLQAARSAPADTRRSSNNEADFLIGTFNAVISRLKEKEHELEKMHLAEKTRADEVQQLNQDLLRSISSGLILIDQERKIRVFNEAAENILHMNRREAVGEKYAVVLERVSPTFRQDIDSCFERRANINRAELQLRSNQSDNHYIGANIMPLKDSQQNFAGVFCIFTDITEFKLLQQHIAQKDKFASLGEMAAGVAHEFRNSVATIAGYAQMAENKMDENGKNYIQPIQKELQALQRVVNEFLSFARPVEPAITEISLQDLIHEVVEEARVYPHKQEVTFSVQGAFPVVPGDEPMLRQVFTNLIRNAVEAIDQKSKPGNVSISGSTGANGRFAVIDIQDTGPGIALEDVPHIFTPFFSRKQTGIGLGLAIAQKFTLQHNGAITVESSSSGTKFRVQLPLKNT